MTDARARLLRSSLLILAVTALLAALLPAAPANAVGSAHRLRFQNVLSRLCLAPAGAATGNNVPIVQYFCDGYYGRGWEIVDSPGGQGRYYLRNIASRLCLSPAGGSTGVNTIVVQYTCDLDTARYWQFVQAGGNWGIRNVRSNLCLSPAGGGTGLNTAIVQFTCDGDPARQWVDFGAYEIQNTNSGWLTDDTNGHVRIQNVRSGLCLSPLNGSTGRNVVIVQSSCDAGPSREWRALLM